MQRAANALLLLYLCIGNLGCRQDEDHSVLPDAAVRAPLKKKVFLANAPSLVLGETKYQYGPDRRLRKSETYSFSHHLRVMREYTEYAYDNEGQQVRSSN